MENDPRTAAVAGPPRWLLCGALGALVAFLASAPTLAISAAFLAGIAFDVAWRHLHAGAHSPAAHGLARD